jgi:hypothetical protein
VSDGPVMSSTLALLLGVMVLCATCLALEYGTHPSGLRQEQDQFFPWSRTPGHPLRVDPPLLIKTLDTKSLDVERSLLRAASLVVHRSPFFSCSYVGNRLAGRQLPRVRAAIDPVEAAC